MQEQTLLKHPPAPRLLPVRGRPRAARRAPRLLDKAPLVAQGHLQASSTVGGRKRSGSRTPESPGPTVAPGDSQAGAGLTPAPQGDRAGVETAPPSGRSLIPHSPKGQPRLLPTAAQPQAWALPRTLLPPPEPHGTPQPQPGCLCPGAEQPRALRAYVPTPRTEEAAWAASALTFLLVLLTLAVLYTRLHRRFHKSQSLYWAAADQEPLSAVLKRRLLAPPGRRKKRHRQRRLLLRAASSESSA